MPQPLIARPPLLKLEKPTPYPAPGTMLVVAYNAHKGWPRNGKNVIVCKDGDDNNVQIQAAIDALPAGAGQVQMTEGQFNINAQVNLNIPGITLEGMGKEASTLKLANSANVTVLRPTKSGIAVRHLGIDGNKANNTSGRGIDASDAATVVAGGQESRLALDSLKIINTAGIGLNIENSVDLTIYWLNDLHIANPESAQCIVFIRMAGIMGNGIFASVSPAGQDNIYLGLCLESSFTNTISDGSGRHGILESNCHKVGFIGGYLGGSIGAGLYYDGDYFSGSRSEGLTVSKMFFNGNGLNTPGQADLVIAPTTEVIGAIITDNQFSHWDTRANTAIRLSGQVNRAVIIGNSFEAYEGSANYATPIDRSGDTGSGSIVRYNPGYVTENRGASTGTGAQQTVVHGLAFTPTRQQIALIAGSATANPYHSAAPDATNIYVTAANGQAWYWATVG